MMPRLLFGLLKSDTPCAQFASHLQSLTGLPFLIEDDFLYALPINKIN